MFLFEFISNESKETSNAYKIALEKKKINSKELKKVKEYTKENAPEIYASYSNANKEYAETKRTYQNFKESDSFFGFKSKRVFAFEFLPTFLLFLYVLWTFYKELKRSEIKYGYIIIHAVFGYFLMFKIIWSVSDVFDLSMFDYYISAVLVTVGFGFAAWFIHKREQSWEKKVQKRLLEVSYHAMLNCDEDRVEDMAKIIEQPIK